MAIVITDDYTTLDECEAITGWGTSTDGDAVALEATNFKKGSNSLKLGKSGGTEAFVYYEKTFSSFSIYRKMMVVWIYIANKATLDVIDQTDCRVYFYDSSGNWGYWNVPLYDIGGVQTYPWKLGWNSVKCAMGTSHTAVTGNRASSTNVGGASATYPDVTNVVKIRLYIATNNAADTFASGDILMDYWHYGSMITVSGGTDGIPADFNDVWAHDNSNALGVFEKLWEGAFYQFCQLDLTSDYFRDYSGKNNVNVRNLTIFMDTRCCINSNLRYIEGSDEVELGFIDDETTKRTSSGINFVMVDNRMWGQQIRSCRLMSCSVQGKQNLSLDTAANIWNCFGDITMARPSGTCHNVYTITTWTLAKFVDLDFYNRITISHTTFLTASNTYPTIVLKNCTAVGNTKLINWFTTRAYAITLLINHETDTWTDNYASGSNGCTTYRAYEVNIKVVDENGVAIQGAVIEIKDVDGNEITRGDSEANLNEGASFDETNLNVTDGTKFAVNNKVMMVNEIMTVDSINVNTVTFSRATYAKYIAAQIPTGQDLYIIANQVTDVNGEIETQLLTHSWRNINNQTEQSLGPFTLTINKEGYTQYSVKFTPEEKTDWTIRLYKGTRIISSLLPIAALASLKPIVDVIKNLRT